jgi:hypothetical protein
LGGSRQPPGSPAPLGPRRSGLRTKRARRAFTDTDPETIVDALEYVGELYREITDENGMPTLGIQNQVVDFIRDNPELSAYVRRWGADRRADSVVPVPPERLPQDAAYARILARLCQVMEEPPVFLRRGENPP